jgi:hypothetical protein
VQHAREWGALPAALARGGAGSAGLWKSVEKICFSGDFYQCVSGQYREALCMYQAQVACTVALRGGDHPNVAASYSNMGVTLRRMGKNQEAFDMELKSLKLVRKLK